MRWQEEGSSRVRWYISLWPSSFSDVDETHPWWTTTYLPCLISVLAYNTPHNTTTPPPTTITITIPLIPGKSLLRRNSTTKASASPEQPKRMPTKPRYYSQPLPQRIRIHPFSLLFSICHDFRRKVDVENTKTDKQKNKQTDHNMKQASKHHHRHHHDSTNLITRQSKVDSSGQRRNADSGDHGNHLEG